MGLEGARTLPLNGQTANSKEGLTGNWQRRCTPGRKRMGGSCGRPGRTPRSAASLRSAHRQADCPGLFHWRAHVIDSSRSWAIPNIPQLSTLDNPCQHPQKPAPQAGAAPKKPTNLPGHSLAGSDSSSSLPSPSWAKRSP